MNPFLDPSIRRYSIALAGVIATAGNKKLGLELTPDEVLGLLAFLASVIIASNAKSVAEAKAAGAAAGAQVVTVEQANEVLKKAASAQVVP